jgi:CheY-like chemotaxis protein
MHPSTSGTSSGRSLDGIRVLTVDDNPDANELVTEILADAGALVASAESAAAAFRTLQAFHPHVLLSDIGMPEEDGYSLIRRVRTLPAARGGETPAIALTAYTQEADRREAIAAGFTLHMSKPIQPHRLIAAVSSLASAPQPRPAA